MIRTQLGSMLETKYGLTYYPVKGAPFDPNIHEAIGTAVSADVKEATVADEFVKGYKLKDRVIRHAKVLVHTPA
jgi:molecular chaperone GrpE